jgi:Type I phosphodiesterase / nucleotide pyrophosphatase
MRRVSEVDSLRAQLRDRGYLTHGIERWFALDPWSSRTFWVELMLVALKAATLIAAFGALPMAAVMVFRNFPLNPWETFGVYVTYAAAWLLVAFVLVVIAALILKVRPALPIDTPRALLAISMATATLLMVPVGVWWYRFDTKVSTAELIVGVALSVVFFLVATIVISAALLSFSIYELQRVPAIHQKPRGVPMMVAAVVLIALLFVPAYAQRERTVIEPMVVTAPTTARVALIAVDGLTYDILRSRPDLFRALPHVSPVHPIPAASTTERWASFGTGVRTEAHGVRAIEGVRVRGGRHIIQRISRGDFVLMSSPVARREPLPPTVRRRDYVWEIAAERGIPAAAVNWWTTADQNEGGLLSISPESILKPDALQVDETARQRFVTSLNGRRLAAVYLPALDIVLNRLELDQSTRLTQSLQVLEGLTALIAQVRAAGFEVVLAGLPGDGQSGNGVVASIELQRPVRAWDIAPTLLDLAGFPLSEEMPGRALTTHSREPRIASYGPRAASGAAHAMNEEYYENLRSLGYIR